MAATIDKYKSLLKKLLPSGFSWNQIKEDEINIFSGAATEFCRVEEQAKILLDNIDPGTAFELIEDWERLLKIPDECTPKGNILSDRQKQARSKLAARGGLNSGFFEDLMASLGLENNVVEDFVDFRVGFSRVGEPLSNHKQVSFRVGQNRVGDQLENTGWRYVFKVQSSTFDVRKFRVGINTVGEPLANFENELLKCLIFKMKPAHTQPFFIFK